MSRLLRLPEPSCVLHTSSFGDGMHAILVLLGVAELQLWSSDLAPLQ